MLTFRQQPTVQSSTDTETRYIGSRKEAVAILEPGAEEGITLEALASKLAQQNPLFEKALKQNAQQLAPLATTEGGGATVTSLRMSAGLTQKEFADKIKWHQPNVSAMESGQRANPTRDTMHLMCKYLNCTIAELDIAIENSKRMLEIHRAKQEREHQALARNKKAAA